MSTEPKLPVAPRARALLLQGGRVRYAPPFVLAPMEGVTHRTFRDLILSLGGVGAAWTEFIRVSQNALRPAAIARELGPPRFDPPVGVQLMGSDPALVAATARNAVLAGAPMIDLNFGCPAPVVFSKCAGSALLDFPDRLTALVRATVDAVSVPVTAKIRLGTTGSERLPEIIAAIERGGAAGITVHARTRVDAYAHPARWEELRRARACTRLPMVGNGDVLTADDAYRMLDTCGVDGVMIGRGVLRDPWIFARLSAREAGTSEPLVTPSDVLDFHARYRDGMLRDGASPGGVLGQLKQLYRRLAVGLALDDAARGSLLRAPSLAALEERIGELAHH